MKKAQLLLAALFVMLLFSNCGVFTARQSVRERPITTDDFNTELHWISYDSRGMPMFKDKDEIIRWAGGKNSPFLFVEFEEFNIRGRDVFILMQNRGSAIIHISITVFIKREDQRWHKLTDALTIVGVMERVRADNDEEAIIFEYEKIMSRELVIGKLPYDMLK